MKKEVLYWLLFVMLMPACGSHLDQLVAQEKGNVLKAKLADKIRSWEKQSGFVDFYWDEHDGKLFFAIEDFDTEFLYINSLAAGVGSNDIGLDRGQLGSEHVVKFQKIGPKVFLTQVNYDYRAESENEMERQSVEEAFAQSVLWGFKVEGTEGGKVLVDATPFLLHDAHDVIGRLKSTKQGSYKVDVTRSAIYLPRCKAFPENSELEATLTFVGEPEGGYIRDVTPTAKAITVRQHHSFVALPDDGYTPRVFDPRCGFFDISFQDYATPIDAPLVKRYITRHRLEKKNPEAVKSEAVEPIIYYLDPGAPEPVRSALLDGARWWDQAFESAGYVNAFQVKILPEGADPMDVRYNLIQWVHRATRGWSYGASVIDPRTGEIIKGHVSLGSLRVRQDFLIAQGLIGPYKEDDPLSDDMQEMALARLRQLSAHEVGHTIGLAHNFAASYNDRASVMDYPHPYITVVDDGSLDFSNAYDDEIGVWDKRTVLYGYQDFGRGINEEEELRKILEGNNRLGLKYISDADARPLGGAHPFAHLWDNGNDAIVEFERLSKIRRAALNNFSVNRIPSNSPNANLEEVLVPIYLAHRFQMQAVVKSIGGVDYAYTMRGDLQKNMEVVPDDRQRLAMNTLMGSMQAEFLALPQDVLEIVPPKPIGYSRTRESFESKTGVTMDPIAIAESVVQATAKAILHPQRANRLLEQKALGKNKFGLEEVLDILFMESFKTEGVSYTASLNRMRDQVLLEQLMSLSKDDEASTETRGVCLAKLHSLEKSLQSNSGSSFSRKASVSFALQNLNWYNKDPDKWKPSGTINMPAGSPIGCGHLRHN